MTYPLVPISVTHPELCKEWSDRNGPLTPDQVSAGSHDRVWWKGKCGHEWIAAVNHRTSHHGCPYCSSRTLLSGFNDIATKNPKLAKEWSDRNLPLTPDQVMPFSRKKLWWRCPVGHEWQATANSRSRGSSCTICQNKKVVPGLNDLPARYPKLISEWGDNNGTLTLDQLRPKDLATRVWWKCGTCRNEYLQLISSKVYRDSKCPYCTGRKLIPGFNDLETTHPELAGEWDADANTEYTPQEVTWISRKYVWWRCPCGHSWGCKLRERTMEQKNCNVCSAELRAVLPGWLLILTAEKLGLKIMVSANTENGMAFDLLLPKVKIAADIGCVSVEGRSRQKEKERSAEGCGYHYTALPISSDLAVITHAVDSVFAKCGFPIAWDLTEDAMTLKERFSQIRKETNNTGKDENSMDDELKKLLLKVILSEEVSTQAGQNVAPTKKRWLQNRCTG